MHEASLAENMLEIAAKAAGGRAASVKAVVVSVGTLSGVMTDALAFAFDAMKKGMGFENASLKIEPSPVVARCKSCAAQYAPQGFPFICPKCQSNAFEIIGGEEIFVKELEL